MPEVHVENVQVWRTEDGGRTWTVDGKRWVPPARRRRRIKRYTIALTAPPQQELSSKGEKA